MLMPNAVALKLAYNNHNLKTDYNSNNKFGWQNSGTLVNHFFSIAAGNKVVLTAITNVVAAGFGTTLPQVDLGTVSRDFINLDQSFDLEPYINIMKLLKLNNYQSFHQDTNTTGIGA